LAQVFGKRRCPDSHIAFKLQADNFIQFSRSMAVLKVTFQSEVRRCLLATANPSYEDVTSSVASLFPEAEGCIARYFDEEGDACTLCPSSFQDFLTQASHGVDMAGPTDKKVMLRLELVSLPGPSLHAETALLEDTKEAAREPAEEAVSTNCRKEESPAAAPVPGGDMFQAKGTFKGKGKRGKGKGFVADTDTSQGWSNEKGKRDVTGQAKWWQRFADRRAQVQDEQGGWWQRLADDAQANPWVRQGAWWQGWVEGHARPWAGWGWHGHYAPEAQDQPSMAGALSPEVLAAAMVCALPKLEAVLRHAPQQIAQHLCAAVNHMPSMSEILQKLWSHLESSGLRRSAKDLASFLEEVTPASAGIFLLSFVADMDALPFEEKLHVLAAFFESQRERVRHFLEKMETRLPFLPGLLVHHGVACDGCGASPLLGPRFKCTSCPDFDLCGTCFAKKPMHEGDCANHEFECKLSAAAHPMHMKIFARVYKHLGALGQLGLGKGWQGKHGADLATKHSVPVCCEQEPEKGPSLEAGNSVGEACQTPGCEYLAQFRGYCCKSCKKGWGSHGPRCSQETGQCLSDSAAANPEGREDKVCATQGCQYQATWHNRFCCKACKQGSQEHGPRCEKLPVEGNLQAESGSQEPLMHAGINSCATPDHFLGGPVGYCGKACGKGWGYRSQRWSQEVGQNRHMDTVKKATVEKPGKIARQGRPCATEGCAYQATWHEEYCCKACKKERGWHGQRCDKLEN